MPLPEQDSEPQGESPTYFDNPLKPSPPQGLMPTSEESRPQTTKEMIFEMFEEPTSSKAAIVIMISLNMMILVSTTCFIIETMPQFRTVREETWFMLESICIAGFTFDFVIRMLTTPSCNLFWTEFMNMVDFVAIMPYYIEMIVNLFMDDAPIPQYLRVIRVVRLARVLRIMRLTKAGRMAGVIVDIAKTSLSALVVPFYFMYTLLVICGTAVYYSEKGAPVSCVAMENPEIWARESALMHPLIASGKIDVNSDGYKDADFVWDAENEKYVDYEPGAEWTLGKPDGNISDAELVRYVQFTARDDMLMTHKFCSTDKMQDSEVEGMPNSMTAGDAQLNSLSKAEFYFDRIFGAKSLRYNESKFMTGQQGDRKTSTYQCDKKISTCCYCLANEIYTENSGFRHVPDGFWFIAVTMTTVGYGDIFPVTWPGRIIAMVTMSCSVFCIAMPLTIVGTSFNSAWEKLEHERHETEEEELKDVRNPKHNLLENDAQALKLALEGFRDDYVGKGDAEKLDLIKEQGPVVQQLLDNLSKDLGDTFQLLHIGLLDM